MWKRHRWTFFVVLIIWFGFFFFGIKKLDPDFGWHLQTGRYIFQQGFPETDPFSYTMPSYPYVSHAWLQDVAIAYLYPHVGMVGLSFFYSLMAVLALFSAASVFSSRISPWLMVMGAPVLLYRFAVRTQVVDWLFFSLLLYGLWEERRWLKWRTFLPFFIWLWSFLHGGFVVGLGFVFFVQGLRMVERRRVDVCDITLMLVSSLLTLVSPYGTALWRELLVIVTGNTDLIGEWASILSYYDLGYLLLVGFSLFLVYYLRAWLSLWQVSGYLLFLFATISASRHASLFALFTISILATLYHRFQEHYQDNELVLENFNRVGRVWVGVIIAIALITTALHSQVLYYAYPEKAVSYLASNPPEGRLFSVYNWGGYLVWKLPEKKTFVDGRMPEWIQRDSPPGESPSAFRDYQRVMEKGAYEKYFHKYGVTSALLPTTERSCPQITVPLLDLRFPRKPQRTSLSVQLQNDGWNMVYQDEIATIYSVPETGVR